MNYKFKVFAGLVITGGIVGLGSLPMNEKLSANIPNVAKSPEVRSSVQTRSISQETVYSAQLVRPYTKACKDRLQKKDISSDISKSVCECSLQQMQRKHTQKEAIGILIKASKTAEDPNTGMPKALSDYFTPCMLEASQKN